MGRFNQGGRLGHLIVVPFLRLTWWTSLWRGRVVRNTTQLIRIVLVVTAAIGV